MTTVTIDLDQATVLKTTMTVCPHCHKPIEGTVLQWEEKVYLQRNCPEHGQTIALISSDRQHYYLRDEVAHAQPAKSSACGCGPAHKSCIALLELTDACNLKCPVCYANSPSGQHRRFEDWCSDLEAFIKQRGPLDVLQLSGGEPTIHPDFLRLLDHCKALPIDHIMINTNGLELVKRAALAGELARRKPGLDRQSHVALRGADLLEQKRAAIETIVAHDLPTTLVCTVARNVNEHELGELLRLGLGIPQIRGITYQPATFSGRYEVDGDVLTRLTLADVVHLIVEQSGGVFKDDDFKPLPCSDPNCCSFTFALRPCNAPAVPLTQLTRYEDHVESLSDRINFKLGDTGNCCGMDQAADNFFRVVIKPFMDVYTYDQDRIDDCCVHVIRPGGEAVSFCQFNALQRGRVASSMVTVGQS
jgi:uncharacterized radical SAM superfamily Fe-S cluster-containing enzyme